MKKHLSIIGVVMLLLLPAVAFSQEVNSKKKKEKKKKESIEEVKKEEDKYGDLVKKCKRFDGLFAVYQDTVTGKTYLEIRKDQLGKDFIYFNHIENAPAGTGYFKGSFGEAKVISFSKRYEKIEIKQTNTDYFYDPQNAISKASNANINEPILASEKVEVQSKDGEKFIIDGDAVFLSEKFELIKYPTPPGAPASLLGGLSSSKTTVDRINNYERNTEVLVSYVYENTSPTRQSPGITDARYVTVQMQHSLLEMPVNNYQSRRDDPRIGYFSNEVTDMTSFSVTPYKDVIRRWHLEKKYPELPLSEPVEPITFWMENTTPVEYREIIKEACERWNIAFEKAGFTNAVVCKLQPDDATWDAGDIRYNVIRWTSSPVPPFGGYGPSFANPLTGQILGADIMLEWVAISNRVQFDDVFKSSMLMNNEKLEMMENRSIRNPFFCQASTMSAQQTEFGLAAAEVLTTSESAKKEIVRQMLFRLVLHEVGHTLGLTHNMRASTMQSVTDIKNVKKVEAEGLCNSVMEYPAFNYQLNQSEQALYCDVAPGPYDLWVIEYGYSPALSDPMAEELRLKKITDRSIDPKLAYGNDADDMRMTGRGIDPDVNIYDLSSDPVAYAQERCELVLALLPKLKEKFTNSNESYQGLMRAYLLATGEYGGQLRIMTRQIGGVHYDRSYFGQATDKLPLTPVSEGKQMAAMAALSKYAFSPKAFQGYEDLYRYMLAQRRGFSGSSDPKLHERALEMQSECLAHLLHPNVLNRVVDSQEYGNTYTLDRVMQDLTNAIFKEDLNSSVSTIRQNLQLSYTRRLIEVLDEKNGYLGVVKSMALFELKRIDTMMNSSSGDVLTKAHRNHIKEKIRLALEK